MEVWFFKNLFFCKTMALALGLQQLNIQITAFQKALK